MHPASSDSSDRALLAPAQRVVLCALMVIGGLTATVHGAEPAPGEEGGDQAPAAVAAVSSGAPRTDIYLVTFGGVDEYVLLGRPRNLTARIGYDNQPAFLPDGSALLYTAIHGDGQADIYRLSLREPDARPVRLTHTANMSEYSPTPMPGGGFSTVRVEPDGAQYLWRLTGVGTDVTRIVPALDNVGYHLWVGDSRLALFLVDEPSKLVLTERADRYRAGAGTQVMPVPIAHAIGRALARSAHGGAVIYTQSAGEQGPAQLRRYDLVSGEHSTWALFPPGAGGDFAIDPNSGAAFTVLGRALLRLAPQGERWLAVGQLEVPGGEITRLAFSAQGDRLALVVEEVISDGAGAR